MSRLICLACLLALLVCAGCAFNRSDFVANADGQPDGNQSQAGKTVGTLLGGPRLRLTY